MTDTKQDDQHLQSALDDWKDAILETPSPGFQHTAPEVLALWPSCCLGLVLCIISLIWAVHHVRVLQDVLMLSTL